MGPRKQYDFINLLKALGIFQFIIWHTYVNFYKSSFSDTLVFKAVFTVTGFFVFTSGFLVGFYYFPKSCTGIKWQKTIKRLLTRAAKLVLIVIAAGFIVSLLSVGDAVSAILIAIRQIVQLLYIDIWKVPLQVLIAIALTIPLAYLFLSILRNSRLAQIAIIICVLFISIYDLINDYNLPYLYRYLFQGLMGALSGKLFYKMAIKNNINRLKMAYVVLIFAIIFLTIEILVISSFESYSIFLYKLLPQTISIISFYGFVGMTLYWIYDLNISNRSFLMNIFSDLGKESLFAYITQIAIIDLIVLLFNRVEFKSEYECVLFSAALFIVCILLCQILRYLKKFPKIENTYNIIFK